MGNQKPCEPRRVSPRARSDRPSAMKMVHRPVPRAASEPLARQTSRSPSTMLFASHRSCFSDCLSQFFHNYPPHFFQRRSFLSFLATQIRNRRAQLPPSLPMFKRKYWSEPKRHRKSTEKGTHDTEKDTEKDTEQPQQAN